VIFDEAHHLPDLARLFFGEAVSTAQLLELARDVRLAEAQHAREGTTLGDAADAMERGARDLRIALGQAAGRMALARSATARASMPRWDALAERSRAGAALEAQEERAEEIRNCRMRAGHHPRRRSRMARGRLAPARGRLRRAAGGRDVRWVEAYPHSRCSTRRPLDVGRIFQAQMQARSARGSSPRPRSR
jgi:ATP-dependent DNA helicase DinG